MKKLVLGVAMMITGFIGFIILCGAAVMATYTINGSTFFLDIWRLFGVTRIAAICLIFGFIGLVLAVIGTFTKSE